jgi:hypothetical protein
LPTRPWDFLALIFSVFTDSSERSKSKPKIPLNEVG